jgi:hypothetical protein
MYEFAPAAEFEAELESDEEVEPRRRRLGVPGKVSQLPGGIGAAGDAHEQAADAIADAVMRGESVAGRLPTGGQRAASGTPARCCSTCATSCAAVCRSGVVLNAI